MGLQLEVELPGGAPSSDLDVLRVVLADGDTLMEDIRQTEETLADLRRQSVDRLVERVDLLREAGGFFPELLRRLACLLRFSNVPRDLVAAPLQVIRLGERLAPLLVPPNHVGEELRFVRCIALCEVLADELGVLPHEPDVQHVGPMRRRLFVRCLEARCVRILRSHIS